MRSSASGIETGIEMGYAGNSVGGVKSPRGKHSRPPKTFQHFPTFRQIVILAVGCLLTFNAGWINAIGILESGVTVSHVTGTLSKVAIFVKVSDESHLIDRLCILAAFVFGAFLSGLFVHKATFNLGRSYYRAILLETVLIYFALQFGSENNRLFDVLLACACGVQNGLTSKYSGNILRTSHHTGTLTDIGILLGHAAKGSYEDVWKLFVLMPLPIFFVLGGLCASFAINIWGKSALFVSIALLLLLSVIDVLWLRWRGMKHKKRSREHAYSAAPNAAATAQGVLRITGWDVGTGGVKKADTGAGTDAGNMDVGASAAAGSKAWDEYKEDAMEKGQAVPADATAVPTSCSASAASRPASKNAVSESPRPCTRPSPTIELHEMRIVGLSKNSTRSDTGGGLPVVTIRRGPADQSPMTPAET